MRELHPSTEGKKSKTIKPANPTKHTTGKKKGVLMPEKLDLANKLLAGVTIPEVSNSKKRT